MRLISIAPESSVDGPGLRLVLFTQGCLHHCPYCHNPETWSYSGGKEFSVRQIIRLLKQHNKYIRGITFSGGEPFLQAGELLEVAQAAHQMNLDIVTYTGFTYEQVMADPDASRKALLYASDILVDGKYVHKLRDLTLAFRGSSNQRMIDISATQKSGQVVLWKTTRYMC